jgi:hypothetical protein
MDKPICEKDYQECQQSCSVCKEKIDGTYYTFNCQVFCKKDYEEQVETCGKCNKVIQGKVIKITGANFHPGCFNCEICDKNMVGVPFTSDQHQKVYCPDDYTKKYSAVCAVCAKPIAPKEGQTTAPRLRALGRDFHPACFKCEDCSLVLDSRIKGKECYPIKDHVLCIKCNRKRADESEEESSTEESESEE